MLPLLLVLFLLPVLGSLGVWQLDRAAQKVRLQNDFQAQIDAEPVPAGSSVLNADNPRYLHVAVAGRFLEGNQQFLLDNRVHQGVAGYEVLSPLYLNDNTVVLVNRGWLPVGESRQHKPQVSQVAQQVSVVGVAAVPPARISLGDALMGDDAWPRVLQFEDFAAIEGALGVAVLPRLLHPDEDSAWSFQRIWQAVEQGPEKNYGYAMQWFALMVALALLVLSVCIKRMKPDLEE